MELFLGTLVMFIVFYTSITSTDPVSDFTVDGDGNGFKCGDAAGVFNPLSNTYTITISFAESNICPTQTGVITYTLNDYTETPSTPVFNADIFKDIFATGTTDEKSIALDTGAMGIDTGTETVTIASTSPDSAPFQISGFSLTVTGSLGAFTSPIEVTLTVDNAGTTRDVILSIALTERPYFTVPQPNTEYEFCEDFIAGDVVADDLTFVDPGVGDAAVLSITDPASTIFTVNKVSATNAEIVLKADFDSSTIDVESVTSTLVYNITVRITDNSNHHDLPISFTVGDVNDNTPTVTAPSEVHVLESVTEGATIIDLIVADGDRDAPNNEVTLSKDGENSAHFELSSNSVLVSTPSALDFSLLPAYNLTIVATDNADPVEDRLTSSTTISIILDTAPAFQKPALTGEAPSEISENATAGQEIYTLEATDQDTSQSLSFEIVSVTPSIDNVFEITDGNILKTDATLTASALDVDAPGAVTQYDINIRVSDEAYFDERSLTVKITDVNDNGPVFSEAVSSVTVPENVASSFITIVATDDDLDAPNNEVTFSVADEDFDIGSSSGEITVKRPLTQPKYFLSVRATDGGSPARSAFATVEITVNGDVVDECATNPCENDATCEPGINSYTCTCATGWSGTQCNINIDDCDPMPCENGGICTDLVADYGCDCALGWEGVNCSTACSGHTFGRNCNQSCACNATNVASSAVAQHCNIQNGSCYCSDRWTGTSCNQDIDECTLNTTICTEAFTVCENTAGGYDCVCRVGYTRTSNSAPCVIDTTDNNPNILPDAVVLQAAAAGDLSINVTLVVDFQTDQCQNFLQTPSVFNRIKSDLKAQIEAKVSGVAVSIFNIRCGSLLYDVFVAAPNSTSNTVDLSTSLERIKKIETFTVENQNVSVTNMTVNNLPIPETNSLCSIYEALSPCGTDYICQVKNNKPYCQEITDDNSDLIIGVGIGIGGLGVLMLIALGVALYVTQRRKHSRRLKSNRKSGRNPRSHHSNYTDKIKSQKSSHSIPSAYSKHSYMEPKSDTMFYYGANGSPRNNIY